MSNNKINNGSLSRTTTTDRPLTPSEKRQVKAIVRSSLRGEMKYFDTIFNSVSLDTTGVFVDLSQIPQGASVNNRVGVEVNLVKLEFPLILTSADQTNALRLTLVKYKPNNGVVAPTSGNLYNLASGIAVCYQRFNLDSSDSYQIIKDKLYATAANSQTFNLNVGDDFNLSGLGKVRFNRGAVTSGEDHLYMFLSSDSAVATHPAITGVCRLWYTDMD